MKRTLFILALLVLARPAAAAELTAHDAWVRLMPPVAQSSAAYMTLKNDSGVDVSVIGVTSDAASATDLHAMRMQDGRMVMFPMESVIVPAHGQFSFAPGGVHIMLMGLRQPLKPGQHVNIVLHLSDGESMLVRVPVRDMRKDGHRHMR